LIHAFIHSSIHPLIHTSTHPLTYISNHPYIRSSIYPLIHACMHGSIHPYIHPCIHPPIHTMSSETIDLQSMSLHLYSGHVRWRRLSRSSTRQRGTPGRHLSINKERRMTFLFSSRC